MNHGVKASIVHQDNTKDQGKPNLWPFKQDLSKHMEKLRVKTKDNKRLAKNNKTRELRVGGKLIKPEI